MFTVDHVICAETELAHVVGEQRGFYTDAFQIRRLHRVRFITCKLKVIRLNLFLCSFSYLATFCLFL